MANDAHAVVNAAEEGAKTGGDAVAAWVAGYCDTYSYAVLYTALAFLLVGLAFVAGAAFFEARKSLAEAKRVEAEARKAAAEALKAEAEAGLARTEAEAAGKGDREGAPIVVPVNAVTTFIKSFAAVLGDAKAWVAMVLIGLLLLWMAGAAPGICGKPFQLSDTNQSADAGDNASDEGNDDAGDNSTGNAADNGSDDAIGNGGSNAVANGADASG
jgi:hypothetical protein